MSTLYRIKPECPVFYFQRLEASGWKTIDWFQPPGSFKGGENNDLFKEYLEYWGFKGGRGYSTPGSRAHKIIHESWVEKGR